MGDAVRCPYCGAEMKIEWWHADSKSGGTSGNYFACKCGARSPQRATEVTAYEAAMQRYVGQNRVLTAAECAERVKTTPVWIESKLCWYDCQWLLPEEIEGDGVCDTTNYGVGWRAWLRRPTDAEREAVAWLT